MKQWKQGDIHPETGNIFWSYSDKYQSREGWLSPKAFKKKKLANKKFQSSPEGKAYSREYYLKNKERLRAGQKALFQTLKEEAPLKILLANVRTSALKRNWDFELDSNYLLELWNKQNGLCYYTRVPMQNTVCKKVPTQVSVDRKDSTIGYTKNNSVLCCISINLAKSNFSEEQLSDFLNRIKSY